MEPKVTVYENDTTAASTGVRRLHPGFGGSFIIEVEQTESDGGILERPAWLFGDGVTIIMVDLDGHVGMTASLEFALVLDQCWRWFGVTIARERTPIGIRRLW